MRLQFGHAEREVVIEERAERDRRPHADIVGEPENGKLEDEHRQGGKWACRKGGDHGQVQTRVIMTMCFMMN